MARISPWTVLGLGFFVIALNIFVIYFPLAYDEIPLVQYEAGTAPLTLNAGNTTQQKIEVGGDPITGLILHSTVTTHPRALHVRLTNTSTDQQIITSAYHARVVDQMRRLAFFHQRLSVQPNDHLLLEITNQSTQPIELIRSDEDHLLLSVLTPQTIPFVARQGVLMGSAVLLLVLIWQFFPTHHYHTYHWLAAVLVISFVLPLGVGGFWWPENKWGVGDWNYRFSLDTIYRRTLAVYHQFPFWNPYTCGGTAGLADPEFQFLSPLGMLELMLGIPAGIRLSIWTSLVILGLGMLTLSHRLRLSPEAGFLAALITTYSSATILKIVESHVTIIYAFMWLPWVLWAWLVAYDHASRLSSPPRKTLSWTIICGLFLAMMFFSGGIYFLMYTVLIFIGLIFLVPRHLNAWRVTMLAGLWAIGFSGIKLIPVLYWLRQFPDTHYTPSVSTLNHLVDIFFGRFMHGALVLYQQTSGWHEYAAYIGYGTLLLALLGSTQMKRPLVRSLLIAVGLTTILASAGPWLIPVFDHASFLPRSNMSRVVLLSVTTMALLAGLGLDQLRQKLWPYRVVITSLIIGIMAIDLLSLAYPISQQAFTIPPVSPTVPPAAAPISFTSENYPYRKASIEHNRDYAAILAGYGTFSFCSVLTPIPGVRTIQLEKNPAFATITPPGDIQLKYWTPNQITVRYNTPQPALITLNTNFAHGWQSSHGSVINNERRLAAQVPAGSGEIQFQYHAPGFRLGALLSLLTVGLASWFLVLKRPITSAQ